MNDHFPAELCACFGSSTFLNTATTGTLDRAGDEQGLERSPQAFLTSAGCSWKFTGDLFLSNRGMMLAWQRSEQKPIERSGKQTN
jgi:hypothetical protein